MQKQYQHFFLFIFLLLIFGCCIRRDILIEKQYTADLRNRIVGARLQMDGKPPYFYCWSKGDSMRYYDPVNCCYNSFVEVSVITASPFFHHLLYPMANLPERLISRIWLCLEYFLLITCLLFAFGYSKTIFQKWAIAICVALILFTEAWIDHIILGQSYIVIPFLIFLFFFCFQRNQNPIFSLIAGFATVSLVLIKPTSLIFFVPFIVFIKRYPIRNILFFLLPIIMLGGYCVLDKNERSYWLEYSKAIKAHIENHLVFDGSGENEYGPVAFKKWEGWEADTIRNARIAYPIKFNGESWNVWVFIRKIFKWSIPIVAINFISLFTITVMIIFFYMRQKNDENLSLSLIAIFGFCLYTTSEFLSPITRYQYYGVEWIFPVLLLAANYDKRLKTIYILLLAGLLLNILNTPYLKMRHSIGEIILLVTLLSVCFGRKISIIK